MAWYGNCSASECKALQRLVRTAQYITGAKLPTIQDLYTRRVRGRPQKLSGTPLTQVIDCSLLPHGKRHRSAKSRTKRHLNSFYPQAIRLLNNESKGHLDFLHRHAPPPFVFTLLLLAVYYLCIVTLPLPTCTK